MAKAVDEFWKKHGRAEWIPYSALEAITGATLGYSGLERHHFWPLPPADAWQAWLYAAHFLQKRSIRLPGFLAAITPPQEIEQLTANWKRGLAIESWNYRLSQLERQQEAGPAGVLELRAVFEPEAVSLEARANPAGEFTVVKRRRLATLLQDYWAGRLLLDAPGMVIWSAFGTPITYGEETISYSMPSVSGVLNQLLRHPSLLERVVGPGRMPLRREPAPLHWAMEPPADAAGDYRLILLCADGTVPPPALVTVPGEPNLYVTAEAVFCAPPLAGLDVNKPNVIPAPAMESSPGVTLLETLGLEPPARLAPRIRKITAAVRVECGLAPNVAPGSELLTVRVSSDLGEAGPDEWFSAQGWQRTHSPKAAKAAPAPGTILRVDRRAMRAVPAMLEEFKLTWNPMQQRWQRSVSKKFPVEFVAWLAGLPDKVDVWLDPVLASLRKATVPATIRLEVSEAAMDWFDLQVALSVTDTTLTAEELRLLLDAKGGFVRLGAKGWRRLALELSPEDEKQLAELGLSAREFSSAPQRLHALQLGGAKTARFLPERIQAAVRRKVEEIQTRVSPPVPAVIQAKLRPYQTEGFHFLAYLTTNGFGGILADDMGLGKTLQTLAWLAWLHQNRPAPLPPALVVCPKSVMGNWAAETARFVPSLQVRLLSRGAADSAALKAARAEAQIVVVNYSQLRLLEKELTTVPWLAVILDEAQFIKNPDSQTARIACTLQGQYRLAVTGTPIENRLLDLWSIMNFAMPGVLGTRAAFLKNFDQKNDPLARLRLSARMRPFLLRRTKSEVAKDLPDRIEEDLVCEMDGPQATLYRAELKRARLALLKLKSPDELSQARFNILSSLLRLRQICCHPGLVSAKASNAASAKLDALLELLEPLLEQGHKVLVFSQFVEMLEIIRTGVRAAGWREFLLTGQTEGREQLVADFQNSEGAAVFLISLRAGGFGLNLTAASYVVLFDPWWNPAVENQAIDRTHRIGQTSKVIAYRLLVKESIEEKIRLLQKQKSSLAADILGEESFAAGLTLADFQFLLSDGGDF